MAEHCRAFWVDTALFKGPRLALCVASGLTEIQGHRHEQRRRYLRAFSVPEARTQSKTTDIHIPFMWDCKISTVLPWSLTPIIARFELVTRHWNSQTTPTKRGCQFLKTSTKPSSVWWKSAERETNKSPYQWGGISKKTSVIKIGDGLTSCDHSSHGVDNFLKPLQRVHRRRVYSTCLWT